MIKGFHMRGALAAGVVIGVLSLFYLATHTAISTRMMAAIDSVRISYSPSRLDEPESTKRKRPQGESGLVSHGQVTPYHPPWYHDIKTMDNPFSSTKPCARDFNYKSMAEALAANASPDKVIVLPSTVDGGYQEMALNYYEFNLHRLNITNYVFMCIDKEACDVLKSFCIPAYLFTKVAHGDKAFNFRDQEFVDKATTKLRIVLSALELGYHVLLSDLDIVFLRNPFHQFSCKDCDVQIQSNEATNGGFNSGFMYIRSSSMTIKAFHDMVRRHKEHPAEHDQPIVNGILKKNMHAGNMKVYRLPSRTWPAGKAYFGSTASPTRTFYDVDKPDKNVVLIHNNWIVGTVAKIYRFKEHLMWVSDYNRYYSDSHRKYIVYDNAVLTDDSTERIALNSAFGIARVLNRTVILPRFAGGTKSVSKFMNIDKFEKTYHGLYRESSFLANPRVPDDVVASMTPQLLIKTKAAVDLLLLRVTADVQYFEPADPIGGATCRELREWFEPFSNVSVLRFHSLYGAFTGFDIKSRRVNCFKSGT